MLNVSASFRWEPVAPLGRPLLLPDIGDAKLTSLSRQGVPHQSTSDDLYNDYHIPANSIVIPNQWWWPYPVDKYWTLLVSQTLLPRAMLNDERVYPEPRIFKPERFLKNGELDRSIRDPVDIAFGFGRRWALFIFLLDHVSLSNVITVLVEFVPESILLIQISHWLLRPYCQLLTWWKKWMRMVEKLNSRGNILNLQGYGKVSFLVLGFLPF
jgi:hypothetical protein